MQDIKVLRKSIREEYFLPKIHFFYGTSEGILYRYWWKILGMTSVLPYIRK